MLQFLLLKSLRTIAVLLGTTLILFLLIHAIPGNPWNSSISGQRALPNVSTDQATLQELNRRYGLDLPLWRQFTRFVIGDFDQNGDFFCGVICGNFGPSTQHRGRAVLDVLFVPPKGMTFWESQFGYSIRLVLFASLIAAGLGIPLGIYTAVQPKSAASRLVSLALATLISIPNFVLGLLAIIIFATWLHWIHVLPNWKIPADWIAPAAVLALMPMASIARLTRAAFLHVIHEDYVRTARAKGVREPRVMLVHVLRNAIVPILTYLGPTLLELFTGLFIIESMYSFPGFGREYWAAILAHDYPMILGLTILYAASFMLINILVDSLAAFLDPRLRAIQQQQGDF